MMSNQTQAVLLPELLSDFFEQESAYLAALPMLLEKLNWTGDQRQLVEALPHMAEHLDLQGIASVMRVLNYLCEPLFEISIGDIDERLTPCLFVTEDEEVFVVLKYSERNIIVYDCQAKQQRQINASLEGNAYIFTSCADTPYPKQEASISVLRSILQRFYGLFLQILGVSFILNSLILATPLFIMSVYNRVIGTGSKTMLVGFVIGVFIAFSGVAALQAIRSRILAYIGVRLDMTIGNSVIERILYLPSYYTETAAVGSQIARIKDFDNVRDFFSGQTMALLFDLPFILLFLAVIAMLGGTLAFVPIVLIALYYMLITIIKHWLDIYRQQASEASTTYQRFMLESFDYMSHIKSKGLERVWGKRFQNISAKMAMANYRTYLLTTTSDAIANAMMALGGLAVVGFGVLKILNGDMTTGAMIAIMILIWRILTPLKQLFLMSSRFSQLQVSMRQINNLMRINPEREFYITRPPLRSLQGKISFSQVSMRYRSDIESSLSGVSINVPVAAFLAITGKSGSGKSTFLKLIMGLYKIQSGTVSIDGNNIQQIDPVELRQAISYVPQQSYFFYGTIKQNLRLANPIASDNDLTEALKAANIYEDINALPEGINTRLGDRNAYNLSGSFMQRLSLARGLLKNSPILLLDEVTDGLDPQQDAKFIELLKKLKGYKTIIMVTQRPSHLRLADQIVVFDQGHIVNGGSPEKVLGTA